VAVVGGADADAPQLEVAEEVGRELARHGAVVVCGGAGGAMEAVCRGAREEGGLTVGILPGPERRHANPHVQVAIATGLGEARNTIVVGAADVVVAIAGEFGTLSEIGFALKAGKPVVGLDTWELSKLGEAVEAIEVAESPADAAARAIALATMG
jgi:uncharacterized protein (TIGR00725 family)